MRLRTRMVLLTLLLLAVVLGTVFYAVHRAGQAHVQAGADAGLDAAGKAISRLMAQRVEFLRQGGEALAAGNAFRQALREADLDALTLALGGHASRFGLDMAMLVTLDGRTLVDTRVPAALGESFPATELLRAAGRQGGGRGLVRIRDKAYQAVLVPVLAPQPAAWLVLGLVVDDATAAGFRSLGGAGVSLMSVGDGGTRVLASSLEGRERQDMTAWIEGLGGAAAGVHRLQIGGREYLARLVRLDVEAVPGSLAALVQPLDEVMAAHRRLRISLLAISALALVVFLYAASLLAGRLTRPLREMTDALRRLGRGRYDTRVTVRAKDELGMLAEGVNRMAGELSARERQLAYLAGHDAGTGLPNRASLLSGLQADLARGSLGPGVLLAAEPVRLRGIEASLGSAVVDGLLKSVVQRIQAGADWRAACLGGERFAFYCPLAQGREPDVWEARVRAVLEEPLEWQGQRFELGAHLGSARYPEDGTEAQTLLRRAEQAMRHGLPAAGTHVAWQPAFDADAARRLALLDTLRGGMATGQLLACYQPRARLSDGRVSACELLVRWRHPERGLLLPEDFIAAAEQTALIRELAHWAIDTAAAQAALWREVGREIAVGVNLSPRNLADRELVRRIAHALARHDLTPDALVVEVGGDVLQADDERVMSVLGAIAALGVGLCIDDFGAAGASLARLSGLPVRELKIDRTFVSRMLGSSQDAAIVKSGIDLAHNLGLAVVAEGVETAEHWQRLLAYGCDAAQGDYLSRPVPAAEFEAWLEEREA